ncbi:MAG TPA: D-alanyl-D-alanine carboxypeptidase [Candidatus Dormibacteraeota bacterium]|nr:D-alanyl-D-alanine carboxypeptidase [Candidatus Dormibacteraeota bacterium]
MRWRIALGLVVLLAVGLGLNYLRPIPPVDATSTIPSQKTIPGTPPQLPWPSTGSAAVGVSGLGKLADSGNEAPLPMASVAKVMAATVVLHDKPFPLGQTGGSITITDLDVQGYENERAQQQSVVPVQAGEVLSEYQALQAMLIPSANNIAETLARWDAGSVPAFVDRMNARARSLGLKRTRFADPAGSSSQSVSTPTDLLALGVAAAADPVFAQIVAEAQARLPVAGIVYNVDAALGKDGINGIKTGSGLESGANFLFSASVDVAGHAVTIFGCVMGQPTLQAAFDAADSLIKAVQAALTVSNALLLHETVATYDTPWGWHANVISESAVTLVEWPGMILHETLHGRTLAVDKPLDPGTPAGTLRIVLGDYDLSVTLITATVIYPPGRFWRLTRLPNI